MRERIHSAEHEERLVRAQCVEGTERYAQALRDAGYLPSAGEELVQRSKEWSD